MQCYKHGVQNQQTNDKQLSCAMPLSFAKYVTYVKQKQFEVLGNTEITLV